MRCDYAQERLPFRALNIVEAEENECRDSTYGWIIILQCCTRVGGCGHTVLGKTEEDRDLTLATGA